MSTNTRDQVVEKIRADLDAEIVSELSSIEEKVRTTSLADLIRAGSAHTQQEAGWGSGDQACALSAGALTAVAQGVISDKP